MKTNSKFLKESLGVSVGGGLGAFARLFVVQGIQIKYFSNFPISILIVNLSGCFVTGTLLSLMEEKMSDLLKAFLFIGFFGAYTTFSDLTFDSINFILQGRFGAALFNIGISLIAGFLLFTTGYYLMKHFKPN